MFVNKRINSLKTLIDYDLLTFLKHIFVSSTTSQDRSVCLDFLHSTSFDHFLLTIFPQ